METDKLPKVFKKKWLDALRSGKYKKGKEMLYNIDKNTYCCLGVACVISGYKKELITHGEEGYIEEFKTPRIPNILIGSDDIVNTLIAKNDGGKSYKRALGFKEIANWIEKNL